VTLQTGKTGSTHSGRATTRGRSKGNSTGGEERGGGRRASGGSRKKSTGGTTTATTSASFSSIPSVTKGDSFTGASNSPPGFEPTPGSTMLRRTSATSATTESDAGSGATRRSSRAHKEVRRFGEFQSWETVAADEVPPSPAFVGNPRQRQAHLEAYAKARYEEEIAARKAAGISCDDTVADVQSRVAEIMKAAEALPDYVPSPSPAKGFPKKSLREQLQESWQGKGYYARLMATMASPSPARPGRPPHMQRFGGAAGASGAAAAANASAVKAAREARATEAAKQQESLANMSGARLAGANGGGYLFANLPGMSAPPAAPKVANPVPAKSKVGASKRKSGDMMPPPGVKRSIETETEASSPEASKSEVTIESVTKTIQKALRRLSMSPAPGRLMAMHDTSTDSSSPPMAGMQLKFGSPSDSAGGLDVDAAMRGDDVEAMRRALKELRRENEELRARLASSDGVR